MTLKGNVDYYLEKILCVILKFKVFFHVFNTRGELGKCIKLSRKKHHWFFSGIITREINGDISH